MLNLSTKNTIYYKRHHKEILLDFNEAESNAFSEAFGKEINNILRGCSVHFFRSAMRVAKISEFIYLTTRIPHFYVSC